MLILQRALLKKHPSRLLSLYFGGEGGIRTLDDVAAILHFECSALDQLCDLSLAVNYSLLCQIFQAGLQ